MPQFLILRLDGPMQAWGTHTFEDFRPVNAFPTRSGLLGLLGACLGIERQDKVSQQALAESIELTVRVDETAPRIEAKAEDDNGQWARKTAMKQTDYHTVLNARKVDGSTNKYPIESHREYLFDAAFTVAVGNRAEPAVTLSTLLEAMCRPAFTPTLGRRSCPLGRPLLDPSALIEATDAIAALAKIEPIGGTIYAEGDLISDLPLQLRDVPAYGERRQFNNRRIYVHKESPS
ncbi:type I-E CRISPR-associated protein Cas5/CasD [Lamprobacter modestohalophilus]|uniref:type I-E CRISPR-associated protein Cas5/CasD n=1 Tax=Lamprobacter modestohalophilus TaxID=1064514 RepID=UPI002ADEEC3B|nr:type I-E CRISPR-associated protein Cas5/CasD [Lamprobacter modestohalophilus]MEA1050883.1 type I-E CRISPR-associated protein Cas5/CasD [Lamprobacter modestohalophilus]